MNARSAAKKADLIHDVIIGQYLTFAILKKTTSHTNGGQNYPQAILFVYLCFYACYLDEYFLFIMLLGSGNPFQSFTNARPLRMTLKPKVTRCCTRPSPTLAALVPERWTSFVSKGSWVMESTPTIHKCVTLTNDPETQGHAMPRAISTNIGSVCPITMNSFVYHVPWTRDSILTTNKRVTPTDYLETQSQEMLHVTPHQLRLRLSQNDEILLSIMFLGQENHSNYSQMRDLHGWPRNSRSRDAARYLHQPWLRLS